MLVPSLGEVHQPSHCQSFSKPFFIRHLYVELPQLPPVTDR
ncbi:hypothetical protein A2U01_0115126, partial [Trifolium medium]|nr:hypothetical protein [Trifolium medium]